MTSLPRQSTGRSQHGLFQCAECAQSYSRLDHLPRHVRSHTQEKPYRCETCAKQFSRVDLLRRHELLHTTATDAITSKRRRVNTSTAASIRASRACEACAEHHLRCEDGKPCSRCMRRNIACVVAPRALVDGLEQVAFSSVVQSQTQAEESDTTSISQDDLPQATVSSLEQAPPSPSPIFQSPPSSLRIGRDERNKPLNGEEQQKTNWPQTQQRSTDRPTIIDLLGPNDSLSETFTTIGLIGCSGELDLDFSAIDLTFLNTYNAQAPFEFNHSFNYVPRTRTETSDQSFSGQGEDLVSGCLNGPLQQTIWRFVPVPGVHAYAEQSDLSLPAQDQIVESLESFVDVTRRATTERLDAQTRDKLLAILLSQVQSHILPAISAFPSVMLLDRLIQFYLAGPIPTVSCWVHTASFRPKKARPELLLAMAAAGAVLTPDRSLRKLGFAIQEVVRNHIPTRYEADNTLVRDLEMSQAYMMLLEIGLWSGSSRKTEIAESWQQPLLSMLRRGGRFKRSNYPTVVFEASDEGPVLDKKWRSWVEQESFKRLAYHLLGHDAQASISLLTNPLVAYSEFDLPLPEPQELWSAPSAAEWKTVYQLRHEKHPTRIPSPTECVASPSLLQQNKAAIDSELSCSSYLYAIWGLVWEYRKLTRLFSKESSKTTLWDCPSALLTRHQELLKMLDYYRLECPNESTLLFELILMHLHMSLEDVQIFCGLEGLEDIDRVHGSLKEWVNSEMARSAVWHAGQLVRAAKEIPAMHLRNFNALSLLHASLTFWVYGLASRLFVRDQQPQIREGEGGGRSQIVYLDGEETAVTYRYITLGRGIPVLRGAKPGVPQVRLTDSMGVMTIIMEIMQQGGRDFSTPNAPLAENLLNTTGRLKDTGMAMTAFVRGFEEPARSYSSRD